MTAEEIAAAYEREADERASSARRFVIDALSRGTAFGVKNIEAELREIEDAVRRDCARRCEAIRAEVARMPDMMRVAPVLSRIDDIRNPSPTMPSPTVYRGAAAGADACACAIRDSIERAR